MVDFTCRKCGAPNMTRKGGFLFCQYCGSSVLLDADEQKAINLSNNTVSTKIDLRSDVEMLLEKCKKDPQKARRYANLILDIDPTNQEALKYL